MPRVSAAFFLTGGLFVLIGMSGGMWMGAHEDFRLMPVHAHLNLVGWVTMALFGGFYALTAKTYSKKLAWTNYALSVAGVVVLSIGAIGLMLMMIRRGAVAKVAALIYLVPPTAAIQAWVMFGESLSPVQVGFMALTAAGVYLAPRSG